MKYFEFLCWNHRRNGFISREKRDSSTRKEGIINLFTDKIDKFPAICHHLKPFRARKALPFWSPSSFFFCRSFTHRHPSRASLTADKLRDDQFIEQKQVLFILLQFKFVFLFSHIHAARALIPSRLSKNRLPTSKQTYLMGLERLVGLKRIKERASFSECLQLLSWS